ncbi:MAG: phosphotransferase [Planctomycetes bacterium]|nr:phosphotransferase [Planctomycetota bacterium]
MTLVCPLPADHQDPAFAMALDRERMLAAVRSRLAKGVAVHSLRPDYVRWKDRDGSLVGWRADVESDGQSATTWITVRTAPTERLADEAERIAHRADEDHEGLRAFALVPGADLLLLSFPLDRLLPDLRRVVRASKLRGLLEEHFPHLVPAGLRFSKSRCRMQIVRYKPERRAVLRWDVACVDAQTTVQAERTLWVRVHAESVAATARLALAAANNADVRCPRLLAAPHDRLLLESHVAGAPWSAIDAASLPLAAATLARLHRATPPPQLPARGPLQQLDLVLRATEGLGRLRPALGRIAAAIADELTHRVPAASSPVLLHGDWHRGQVLLADDAGFCDFDRACSGPPALDLATFHAHEMLTSPEHADAHSDALLSAYAQHSTPPTPHELAWWQAGELIRIAMTPFRRLAADWPEVAFSLLERAAVAAQRVRA